MSTQVIYRPGQTVPVSGIYAEVTKSGAPTGRNAVATEGEPFSPTQGNGYGWVLIQPSNP